MANKLPWFRLYTEILDDKKIKRVCRTTGESKALIIGVWVILLSLASDSDERGMLYISDDTPYTFADLADETGLAEDVLVTVLNEFSKLGMLNTTEQETLQIIKWNDRQYKSDNSSERVKKHRETLHNRYSNGDVTPPDTETDTDTDTELTTAGAVFSAYEREIGVLTPHIAERLKDASELYTDGWLIDAIKIASEKQVRNMKYIEAILARWHTEGKDNGTRKPAVAKKPERNVHSGAELANAWGAK